MKINTKTHFLTLKSPATKCDKLKLSMIENICTSVKSNQLVLQQIQVQAGHHFINLIMNNCVCQKYRKKFILVTESLYGIHCNTNYIDHFIPAATQTILICP